MTDCRHIEPMLQDYADGELPPARAMEVAAHLAVCAACRAELEALQALRADLAALPRDVAPPAHLWPGIAARLDAQPEPRPAPLRRVSGVPPASRRARTVWSVAAIVTGVLLLLGGGWLAGRLLPGGWRVVGIEGTPRLDASLLDAPGRLRVGKWLETDAASRARIDVGLIGEVEVGPGTRVQLQAADASNHRLRLEEGVLEAYIWAPPRLFFVETPAALAIDLGCAYTLAVDSSGTSRLHVTSGYVELVHEGRTTVVPAGAMCEARPGQGPGTPYDRKASTALRRALAAFDFEDAGDAALEVILAEAGPADAITLWNLFTRVSPAWQAVVYDRLAALVPPPEGVTRAGTLGGDEAMTGAWRRYLGLEWQ